MIFTSHEWEADLPQGDLTLAGHFHVDPTNRCAWLLNCDIGELRARRNVLESILGAAVLTQWEIAAYDAWAESQDDFWAGVDQAMEAAQ